MATPVPASLGGAPGSLRWSSPSATVDEALNQREFEAARHAWLASALAPQQTGKGKAATLVKPPIGVKTKGSVGSSTTLARADLLMQETAKMEAKLALLRKNMTAEKEKRATTQPSRASAAPGSRAASLAATTRLGGPGAIPTTNVNAHLARVGPKIDTQNTFLQTKVASEKAATLAAARDAKAKADEARRLAALKAAGHTLLTYAPTEAQQKWEITREESDDGPSAADVQAMSLGVRGIAGVAAGRASGIAGVVPRKVMTAADMMRGKRKPSATSQRPTVSPPSAVAAPIDRTQFNLVPRTSSSSTDTSTHSSSLLLGKGEFDEEANAQAFAQAREEFLRSLQPDGGDSTVNTSSEEASPDLAKTLVRSPDSDFTSPIASTGTLPSNWWEQPEPSSSTQCSSSDPSTYLNPADSSTAAPGSLLDGPAFDEQASAGDFREARKKWMEENSGEAVAPAAAAPVKSAASSSSAASADPSTTATATAARSSCYTCYKLYFIASGVLDSESGKQFCTGACRDAFLAEKRETCTRCQRKVQRMDAQRVEGEGEWICKRCASALPPSSSSSTDHGTAVASSSTADEPVISLFGSDDFDAPLVTMRPLAAVSAPSETPASRAKPKATVAFAESVDGAGSISAWEQ
jgi:hypothetical protein